MFDKNKDKQSDQSNKGNQPKGEMQGPNKKQDACASDNEDNKQKAAGGKN